MDEIHEPRLISPDLHLPLPPLCCCRPPPLPTYPLGPLTPPQTPALHQSMPTTLPINVRRYMSQVSSVEAHLNKLIDLSF